MVINNATVAQKFLTKENWESRNPILLKGEVGFFQDTDEMYYFKVGNGTSTWNELPIIFASKEAIIQNVSSMIEDAVIDYNGRYAIQILDKESGVASVELKLNSNEQILNQDSNGLSATLKLSLNNDTGVLSLLGKGGVAISSVDFPVESILKDSSFDVDTGILTLTFNTSKGDQVVKVDLSGLIDVYSAGVGLSLSAGGEFSVKKSAGSESFLTVDSSGIAVTGITAAISTAINTTLKVTTTGSGNVITGLSKSGATITATKGMEVYSKTEVNSQVSNAITTARGYTDALSASLADGLVIVCGFKD